MPKHLEIEAHIEVDGKPLEEFGGEVDSENERAYNCFVASEAGKAFTIRVGDPQTSRYILRVSVDIDGLRARSTTSGCIDGFPAGNNSYRQFVFTEVTLTDDDDAAQSSDGLGVIKLKIRRRVKIGKSKPVIGASNILPDEGPLQEKSKKLGGHRIGAGGIITRSRMEIDSRPYDLRDPDPFVVFRFMYRPIEILRAQNIAPRLIPSPVPEQIGNSPSHPPPHNSHRKTRDISSASNAVSKVSKGASSSALASGSQLPRLKRGSAETDEDEELTLLDAEIEAKQKRREELRRKRVKREPSIEVVPKYEFDENGAIDLTAD